MTDADPRRAAFMVLVPKDHELEIAVEVLLARIQTARDVLGEAAADHTTNLIQSVTERLNQEPLEGFTNLRGFDEAQFRKAKGVAVTLTALAHLEAQGAVLPFGNAGVRQREGTSVVFSSGSSSQTLQLGDPYNFSLADIYRLPHRAFAPDVESPTQFMSRLPSSMGPKVQRLLREAVDAYRARTYVVVVILLATASEAAWIQVGERLKAVGDLSVSKPLADEQIARIQDAVGTALVARKILDRGERASLDGTAQTYRELRNHAVHRPETSFDETLFTGASAGTLLRGCVLYFRRLYDAHDVIS